MPCKARKALQHEPTAYRSLLIRLGAVLAAARPMLARLARGCIALAFIACVRADACSHRLADTVKGGRLSYMALAIEREQIAYISLLSRPDTVHADPEATQARLARSTLA